MYRLKTIIAVIMFKLGIRYSTSMFIDGKTLTYGYGKLHAVGTWEYQIPNKYIKKN